MNGEFASGDRQTICIQRRFNDSLRTFDRIPFAPDCSASNKRLDKAALGRTFAKSELIKQLLENLV